MRWYYAELRSNQSAPNQQFLTDSAAVFWYLTRYGNDLMAVYRGETPSEKVFVTVYERVSDA